MPTGLQLYDCADPVNLSVPPFLGAAVVSIASQLYSFVFPNRPPVAWNDSDLQASVCFVFESFAKSHLTTKPGPQTQEWYYERCCARGMVMDIAQKAILLTAQRNNTLNPKGARSPTLQIALRNGVEKLMQNPAVLKTLQSVRGEAYKAILLGKPIDPNQVSGPVWSVTYAPYALGSEEPYVYTIQFGNLPNAAAPATLVTVACTLPGTLDPTTLIPELITFEEGGPAPGHLYSATPTPSPWHITLDAGQVTFAFVQTPPSGHQLTWTLTGSLVQSAVGSVSFSIYPMPGAAAPAAASMPLSAVTVAFNTNAPLHTNQWP